MKTHDSQSPYGEQALKIMKHLLSLKDQRLIDPGRIRQGLPLKGDTDIAHDIQLITEIKALVHKFPLRIYKDDTTRQYLLDGIQALLDQLINREDELLAGQEA